MAYVEGPLAARRLRVSTWAAPERRAAMHWSRPVVMPVPEDMVRPRFERGCNAGLCGGHSHGYELGWFVTSVSTDDRTARFTALFDEHVTAVRGFVRTKVLASEVESIVQATFETAWMNLGVIPLLSRRAWLFGPRRTAERPLRNAGVTAVRR